jgi:hypothetical protein
MLGAEPNFNGSLDNNQVYTSNLNQATQTHFKLELKTQGVTKELNQRQDITI